MNHVMSTHLARFRPVAALAVLSFLWAAQGVRLHAAGEEVAVVVKIGGIPWFTVMEKGIRQAGMETNLNASMVGPTTADPAQQVRAVEDLIARKVRVIAVVPNDATALEPVFARARAAGIAVLTHESPNQRGADWDLEMMDNDEFAAKNMSRLAQAMGGEGDYIVFVGSLTVPLHNLWADAAIAYQRNHFPKMHLVADRYGVAESVDDSFNTTSDALLSHPNLRGILTFGSQGPIGAGRAVRERGMAGKIAIVGGFSPTQGRKLLKEGVIAEGFFFNPREAGYALVYVAKMIVDGTPIRDGFEIPGLGRAKVDADRHVIRFDRIHSLNRDTIDEFAALGL
jgi:simple sugar transport system substrate-binding protein